MQTNICTWVFNHIWVNEMVWLLKTEYSYKQLFFLAESSKHLHGQSYESKLVSAMLNFHAKTEDFGLINIISRHSSS